MSVVAYSLCRGMGNLMVHLMVLYSRGGGLSAPVVRCVLRHTRASSSLPVDVAFAVIGDISDIVVLHIYVLGWLIHSRCLMCERILARRGVWGRCHG